MNWTALGTPIKLDIDWQFTEPVEGVFFRFKHENPPANAIYEIGQVELNGDGSTTIFNSQVLVVETDFEDVIKLVSPKIFTQRRLAIRRIPAQPTFEQEIRRLLLPKILQSTDIPQAAPARNRWQVTVESSDYVEPSAHVDLTPIQTKLDEISTKIDNLQSSSGVSTTPTTNYYLQDTFTDTDDKAFTAHVMDIGGGWTTSDINWKISNNKATTGYAVNSGTVAIADSRHSDLSVEANINWSNQGVNSQQGLVLRAVDSQNYLLLRYVFPANNFRITQTINGTQTDLVSANVSVSSGASNSLKFTASGTKLMGYLDNRQIITVDSSNLINATKCGLWCYEQSSGFAASWDSFIAKSIT